MTKVDGTAGPASTASLQTTCSAWYIASALLGMGLTQEFLRCERGEVRYSGMMKRNLHWRWSKISKMVMLRDVAGIHESRSFHHIFLVFGDCLC